MVWGLIWGMVWGLVQGNGLRIGLGNGFGIGLGNNLGSGLGNGVCPGDVYHTSMPHWMLGYTHPVHCMLVYTPSPLNRMTDRCKNISLPQTSFAFGRYE